MSTTPQASTNGPTIPVRLLVEHDQVTFDGRLIEILGCYPQRRLGDERREYARTYEVSWMDVETWQVAPGAVFAADFEFELVATAAEAVSA